MKMRKKFKLRLRFPDEEIEIEMEPIKREDIPEPTEEDQEFMRLWNLRLFPFIVNNYDMLFKKA